MTVVEEGKREETGRRKQRGSFSDRARKMANYP